MRLVRFKTANKTEVLINPEYVVKARSDDSEPNKTRIELTNNSIVAVIDDLTTVLEKLLGNEIGTEP